MTKTLRIGYIPLVDLALISMSHALMISPRPKGSISISCGKPPGRIFATSWASAFSMPPICSRPRPWRFVGLGYPEMPLVAPVALGLDGNAITLSRGLYDDVMSVVEGDSADPYVTAQALVKIVAKRRASGAAPLTFAHVFPFSTHHYQLRLWFAAGGLELKADVNLIVVPPPFMVESLRSGLIDGFCVGAPWNGLAVSAGVGRIIHRGREIVRNRPEKLLAFRADVASADPIASSPCRGRSGLPQIGPPIKGMSKISPIFCRGTRASMSRSSFYVRSSIRSASQRPRRRR